MVWAPSVFPQKSRVPLQNAIGKSKSYRARSFVNKVMYGVYMKRVSLKMIRSY